MPNRTGLTLISSHSHVIEPANLWDERIEARYRDRALRLVRGARSDQWLADGAYQMGNLGVANAAGLRFERPDEIRREGRIDELASGANEPVRGEFLLTPRSVVGRVPDNESANGNLEASPVV